MMENLGRLAERWGWQARECLRRGRRTRSAIGCESMETRALMANNALANLLPLAPATTIGVVGGNLPGQQSGQAIVITPGSNPKLIAALEQFLGDLESTLNRTGTATGTLQADLDQIARLAGSNDSRAVQRLNSDVTTIVASGAITAPQRLSLISDLESVVLGAGVPGSVVVSAANQALVPSRTANPMGTESSSALADPNALGTPSAGSTRGQEFLTNVTAVPLGQASGSAAPDSSILGRSFRTLMDDLKTLLAKSPTVSPAQKRAVRSDFAAVAFSSHQPDAASASALQKDLDAIAIDGRITNDGRAKIAQDLTALLGNAGVPARLIDRTLSDLGPVIRAEDLSPGDLKILLGDLINLLLARPKAVAAP